MLVAPDQIDLVGVMAQVGVQLHRQVASLLMAGRVEAAFRQGMALVAVADRISLALAMRCAEGSHDVGCKGFGRIVSSAGRRTSRAERVCASAHRMVVSVAVAGPTP